jgi:uncharacterized Zn-binding protein involved in type VI secretion
MGSPALAMGDKITGTCSNHLIPSASGTQPAGPLPFSAPLTDGLVSTVQIGGKAAAVMGSSGYNLPPHVGIVDGSFASPTMQVGRVMSGSSSVMIGGKPAATTQSNVLMCVAKATTAGPGVTSVEIG